MILSLPLHVSCTALHVIDGKPAGNASEFTVKASKAYAALDKEERECLSHQSLTAEYEKRMTKKEVHREGAKIFRRFSERSSDM